MQTKSIRQLIAVLTIAWSVTSGFCADAPISSIRHSYLVLGAKTAIIGEDSKVQWEYTGGSRDGFVLPNGNVLIAWADHVEEVTREKQLVWTFVEKDGPGIHEVQILDAPVSAADPFKPTDVTRRNSPLR